MASRGRARSSFRGKGGKGYGSNRYFQEEDDDRDYRQRSRSQARGAACFETSQELHAIGYQYSLLSRMAMPHPGRNGQSFFRRNTSDSQTLTPQRIQQGLSHETSEWHNGRLANATSFLAGNLRQLVGITKPVTQSSRPNGRQSSKRTGIPQLASYFSTSDGKKLAQVARYLDFNAGEERNEEDLAVALLHLFKEIPKLSSWCQRSA